MNSIFKLICDLFAWALNAIIKLVFSLMVDLYHFFLVYLKYLISISYYSVVVLFFKIREISIMIFSLEIPYDYAVFFGVFFIASIVNILVVVAIYFHIFITNLIEKMCADKSLRMYKKIILSFYTTFFEVLYFIFFCFSLGVIKACIWTYYRPIYIQNDFLGGPVCIFMVIAIVIKILKTTVVFLVNILPKCIMFTNNVIKKILNFFL